MIIHTYTIKQTQLQSLQKTMAKEKKSPCFETNGTLLKSFTHLVIHTKIVLTRSKIKSSISVSK